ncbi:hypothetical protein CALVIDRAFT_214771 [Calocera viscosa TUFC12733]|uniref:Uncharacterized protein n=1 Tax=Calocera viscosa (strain TUFC12733) TaxID=1330018 RepID=A0A167RER5_CALVF|nr:hypothetical protein CALVIDRAFT_214771 [Calocera viscosa TUFC12733]
MYSSLGSKSRLVTFNPDQDESAGDYAQNNPATVPPSSSSSQQQRPISRREYARMMNLQREIANQPQPGRPPQPSPRTPLQVVGSAPGPSTPISTGSSTSFTGSTPTASTSTNITTPPTPSPVTPSHYHYPPEQDVPPDKGEREDPFHQIVTIAGHRYGPGHVRTGSNTSAMEPSPITAGSTPQSSSYTPIMYERPTNTVLVGITQDGDYYQQVDITGVNGGPRIRERILSSLGYPSDYHRDFSLYKTEWGTTPDMAKDRGAVSESKLLEQVHGAASNNKTTLKYYVEHNPGAPPLPAAGPSRPGPVPIQMVPPGTSPSHVAANSPEQLTSPTSAVSGGSPMPAQNGFLQQHPQHLQPQPRASPTHTSPPPLPPHPYLPPIHANTLPAPPNQYYVSPPPYAEAARQSHSYGPPADEKRAPTPQPPMSAPLQRAPRESSRPPPIQYQPNLPYASSPAPPPGPASGSAAHGRTVSDGRRQPPMPTSAPPNVSHAPGVPPYDGDMYAAPSGGDMYANVPQFYRPAPPIPVKMERRKVSIDGRAEALVRSPSPAALYSPGPSTGGYGRRSEEQEREALERERANEKEREKAAERERADRERQEREREDRDRAERERQRQPTPQGTYGNGQRIDSEFAPFAALMNGLIVRLQHQDDSCRQELPRPDWPHPRGLAVPLRVH